MKTYIGTKTVKAQLTTRAEYVEYQGWELPAHEDGTDEVYLVEYPVEANTKPNHKDHEGYVAMSPKEVFEKYYKPANDYKERLVIEINELNAKITLLSRALKNNDVPDSARAILHEQLEVMIQYSDILTRRYGS